MAADKAEPQTLKLSAVLDLNEATVLHGNLMSLRGRDLVVDASSVDRLGVQCAQVLAAAGRAWREDGKSFLVGKVSDAFQKTMQLIGINIEDLVAKEIKK